MTGTAAGSKSSKMLVTAAGGKMHVISHHLKSKRAYTVSNAKLDQLKAARESKQALRQEKAQVEAKIVEITRLTAEKEFLEIQKSVKDETLHKNTQDLVHAEGTALFLKGLIRALLPFASIQDDVKSRILGALAHDKQLPALEGDTQDQQGRPVARNERDELVRLICELHSTSPAAQAGPIQHAVYQSNFSTSSRDVTLLVNFLLATHAPTDITGGLPLNSVFGDPAPFQRKSLVVSSGTRWLRFSESQVPVDLTPLLNP